MPHVAGHVQNDILRRGRSFPKKGGVVFPHSDKVIEVLNWNKEPLKIQGHVDFPLMFINDDHEQLTFGQSVRFLLHIVGKIEDKYLVVGRRIIDSKKHEALEASKSPAFEAIEEEYRRSADYEIIFKNNKDEEDHLTVKWLLNHALPFDEMNLATN
jgi:hypothetical protein